MEYGCENAGIIPVNSGPNLCPFSLFWTALALSTDLGHSLNTMTIITNSDLGRRVQLVQHVHVQILPFLN